VRDHTTDVLIIGAGAAGLAAAQILSRSKLRVLLLEARDRIGGRIWTRTEPGLAAPVEYGAEFIHGHAPATMAILHQGGRSAIESTDTHLRLQDGRLVARNDFFHEVQELMRTTRALVAKDMSFDDFLGQSKELSPAARQYAKMMAEGFDAADTSRASARAIVAEWTADMMSDDAPQSRPQGGYDALLATLASALQSENIRLQLQTTVHAVHWSKGLVEVEGTFMGEPFRVSARRAIITLPLGVLQQPADARGAVRFSPALAEKRQALQDLSSGPVIKLMLRFRSAFWEELDKGFAQAAFFHVPSDAFQTFWTQLPLRAPLLNAWAGGPRALRLSSGAPADMVGSAIATLQSMFGKVCDVAGELECSYYHDWQQDPFARGAYSYVNVAGDAARGLLAAPIANTLFFAGEATDTEGETATVAGALQSGTRAAREVLGE
jgi:monoamine oxidase